MAKEAKILILVSILILGGAIGLGVLSSKNQQKAQKESLVRSDSYHSGNTDAKVTLIEFGDFECPACGQIAPTVEEIRKANSDPAKFNLIFRNFPLPQHANAISSAEAAEASGAQGKFWEMYTVLYAHQDEWSTVADPSSIYLGYAQQLGLNLDQFKKDMQQHTYLSKINRDKSDSASLNLPGTPSFFLNGTKLNLKSFDDLKKAVDDAIKNTP